MHELTTSHTEGEEEQKEEEEHAGHGGEGVGPRGRNLQRQSESPSIALNCRSTLFRGILSASARAFLRYFGKADKCIRTCSCLTRAGRLNGEIVKKAAVRHPSKLSLCVTRAGYQGNVHSFSIRVVISEL
eukprot:6197520-Pleurochrysis_carterae.AAC.6